MPCECREPITEQPQCDLRKEHTYGVRDAKDFPLSILTDYELWDKAKQGRFRTWCKGKKDEAPDFYFESIAPTAAGNVAV